jgi:hypothetical protein
MRTLPLPCARHLYQKRPMWRLPEQLPKERQRPYNGAKST